MNSIHFALVYLFLFSSITLAKTDGHFLVENAKSDIKSQLIELRYKINHAEIFNETNCYNLATELSDTLKNISSQNINLLPNKNENIVIYQLLFRIQVELQNQFHLFQNPSRNCVMAIRNAIRENRLAADKIIDKLYLSEKIVSNLKMFSDIGTQTLINTDMEDENHFDGSSLKTGDVLLMRGQTSISALIARFGDEDSSLSHAGIVGEDESGNKYMVEAGIETGVRITPLREWLNHEKARIAVYRYQDNAIATEAGKKIYLYSKKRIEEDGLIPYDFTMNADDHSEIFCSELVRIAFELATNFKVTLPTYKTSFYKLKDKDIYNDLGISAVETFSPSDIELEPHFTLVAEYRSLKGLRKIEIQDAIMSSILLWSSQYGYTFSPNLKAYTLSAIAKAARKIGLIKKRLPKHIPRRTIVAIIRVNDLAGIIEKHMIEVEKKVANSTNKSTTLNDLTKDIENYRKKDCLQYWENHDDSLVSDNDNELSLEIPSFHHLFNNKNKNCNL